jgi:hypothetical protein
MLRISGWKSSKKITLVITGQESEQDSRKQIYTFLSTNLSLSGYEQEAGQDVLTYPEEKRALRIKNHLIFKSAKLNC